MKISAQFIFSLLFFIFFFRITFNIIEFFSGSYFFDHENHYMIKISIFISLNVRSISKSTNCNLFNE